jgi:serine/threonine protein kinase
LTDLLKRNRLVKCNHAHIIITGASTHMKRREALKIVNMKTAQGNSVENLRKEAKVLGILHGNKNVTGFCNLHEIKNYLGLAIDYASGGILLELMTHDT